MTEYGLGSKVDHDYVSSNPPPRYLFMFAEREASPDGTPGNEDPIFGFRSATGTTSTDARFVAGILSGVLPTPEHNITASELSAGIIGETDRVTVKPGIILDPVTQGSAPTVNGSLIFNTSTGELNYYSGGWQILTTGSGMTAHDLTGAYHTEDATGGAGNVIVAITDTTFAWAQMDYTDLANIPSSFTPNAHILGTSGPHTGTLPWADLDKTSSSLADLATRTHASLSDAPADAHHTKIHNLIDTINHPVTALTGGHFLKALTDTTYGFAAHGLGASDVGAYTTAEVDSAIDADILTHKNLATAHQDAPALISTHASDDDAHHAVFESSDFTTAFAAENFNNLATTAHVLASADHTVSGLTAGDILSADTATTYSWKANPAVTVPLALTDLASYTQGSLIIGGAADWEALGAGTDTYILKMGASEPSWGTVNYSELVGTQPAPINHNLVDTTKHPVSGLTPGHYLKALTATTYGFAAVDAGIPYQPIVEKDAIVWRPDLTTWSNGEYPDFCSAAPGHFELVDADNYLRVNTSIYYASGYDSASLKAHHSSVDPDKVAQRIYLPLINMPAFEIRFRWRRAQASIRGHRWTFYAWFWDGTLGNLKYKALFELEHLTGGVLECQSESTQTANDTLSYSIDTWYDLRFQVVGQKGPAAANAGQMRSSMIASSGSTWQSSWSDWYDLIGTDATDVHMMLAPAFITVQVNNQSYACDTYIDDLEILYCDVTLT